MEPGAAPLPGESRGSPPPAAPPVPAAARPGIATAASLWQRRAGGAGRGALPRLLRPRPTAPLPAPRICRGCGEPDCLPSGRGRSSNAGMVTFRILEISSMGPASPSACPAHEGSWNLPVTKLTLGCPGCLSVQNLHNFLPCCYSPDLTARTTFCAQSEQSSYTTRKIL